MVERDKVWAHARRLADLPVEEYVRMGGPEHRRILSSRPDPSAKLPRAAAVKLLGEIVVDREFDDAGIICHDRPATVMACGSSELRKALAP